MHTNDADTVSRTASGRGGPADQARVAELTILCHPDPERVGEQTVLLGLLDGKSHRVSRQEPLFAPVHGGSTAPLSDTRLSRKSIRLQPQADGGVLVDASATRTRVEIDGEVCGTQRRLDPQDLDRGVVLLLAGRIAVLLRVVEAVSPIAGDEQLVGESVALWRARAEITRVADLDFPVFLRGETGTGKELAARAIHRAGPRRDGPFVAVNVGAIPADLVAAELFGAVRGAYTGAHRERAGHFERASGGTLFLDELGEAPAEVQVHLLRVLESGRILPVGAERPRPVDVRVVAATDADLEGAAASGDFRAPLLHRLSGYEIELPPLRERLEDFGRLFFHFLGQELAAVGESERLAAAEGAGHAWVPAELIAGLVRCPWPGNVRQLKNAVRQIVVASRGERRLVVPPSVQRELESLNSPQTPKHRSLRSIGDDELIDALRAESFNVTKAAARLNVSKTVLYKRMDQCARIRKASEIRRDEIDDANQRFEGDVNAMANFLEVSPRGLLLRMKALGV